MGSNYTPAPWRIRDAGNGIYDNTDDGVYDVVGRGPYGEITLAEEVDIHDAHLIAAAPAMLAALEGLLNALPSATTHPAIKAARAAIAQAKGGANG